MKKARVLDIADDLGVRLLSGCVSYPPPAYVGVDAVTGHRTNRDPCETNHLRKATASADGWLRRVDRIPFVHCAVMCTYIR